LTALRGSTATDVNLADSCNLIIAVFMAYLILKEVPTNDQILGGGIILLGIILSFLGNLRQKKTLQEMIRANPVNSHEMISRFKRM